MAELAFYHLTRSTAAEALPALLQKTMAAEKRALVCCDLNQAPILSTALWSFGEGSWLPHGMKGKDDADAEICPIWFSDSPDDNKNKASFIFFINAITPEGLEGSDRVFVLFDGNDEAAVATARSQWKALHGDGHQLSYWQQDDSGRWSQSA